MSDKLSPLPAFAARAGAVTVAAGLVVASAAAPASAHVSVSPTTTEAGAYAVLDFGIGHGCEGSATTKLEISLPAEIPQADLVRHPLWTGELVTEELDEPTSDAHGNEITERVTRVVYTSTESLPDGVRDSVALSVQLPDAAGETLAFPVVQTCEQGSNPWTEVAAEGQDPHALDLPAPTLTITEAAGDGHGGEAADEASGEEADTETAAETDEGGNGLSIAALVAGIGGLLVGGIALARGRKG